MHTIQLKGKVDPLVMSNLLAACFLEIFDAAGYPCIQVLLSDEGSVAIYDPHGHLQTTEARRRVRQLIDTSVPQSTAHLLCAVLFGDHQPNTIH